MDDLMDRPFALYTVWLAIKNILGVSFEGRRTISSQFAGRHENTICYSGLST